MLDLKEIREYEKLATIRKISGFKSEEDEKKAMMKDSSMLLETEIKQKLENLKRRLLFD